MQHYIIHNDTHNKCYSNNYKVQMIKQRIVKIAYHSPFFLIFHDGIYSPLMLVSPFTSTKDKVTVIDFLSNWVKKYNSNDKKRSLSTLPRNVYQSQHRFEVTLTFCNYRIRLGGAFVSANDANAVALAFENCAHCFNGHIFFTAYALLVRKQCIIQNECKCNGTVVPTYVNPKH